MSTIRVRFTTIPSLLNQSRSVLRFGRQNAPKLHGFTQQNLLLAPSQTFFAEQKRNLSKLNDSDKGKDSGSRSTVYVGLLSSQIKTVKWFSLSTSLVGIVCQPILYQQLSALQNLPMLVVGCSFVGIYTFVTPFLLHYVTKKYVTSLDYDSEKDTYIASSTNFFGLQKQLEFKTEDVTVPDIPGMFTTFHVKGQAMFLEARLFEDPGHYARLMGYDKPMDFKLYQTAEDTTKEDSSGKK